MALPINSPSMIPDREGDLAFLEEAIVKSQEENQVVKKLALHIDSVWRKNQEDAKPFRKEMIQTLRRVRGEYDSQKLADIRAFKGSEVYIRSSENKARAAVSWIKDLYRVEEEMPWSIKPTSIPDLPGETLEALQAEVQQQAVQFEQEMVISGLAIDRNQIAKLLQEFYEDRLDEEKKLLEKKAKERCERASEKIKDQNQEGGWSEAFKDFLYYFVRLKMGIIKGPILTKKKKQVWVATETGYELQTEDTLVNDVYCVTPFNFYPSKGMKTVNDGDVIEVHELTRQAIADLIGVPGYSEEEIRIVLDKFDNKKLKTKWFTVDDETEVKQVTKDKQVNSPTVPSTQNATDSQTDFIFAQEFYGTVSGKLLIDWGFESPLDPAAQYQANCWKIGDHVIKAVINPDPLGRKPYHVSSWAKSPDTIIGEGLIEFAAPIEDAMNAVARALINNIAIASGPMAEVDKDRVDTKLPIYPWRQIESTSMQMKNEGPAVAYYQPQMHAESLINAFMFFSKLLDEMTVPAYAQGASQSGVTAGTATVFTQLLAAASRSIKAVVANIDDDIITPYITMCYDLNNTSETDHTVMGDVRIVAKGLHGLLAKEQQAQRKIEYLQVAMTPVLSQILGAKNLGSIAAQIAKANDISLPDMKRLEGDESVEDVVSQMLMAQSGVDPIQQGGQVANGGGAPAKPEGELPDGSKAGVVNA